jgi:hypothetical protein
MLPATSDANAPYNNGRKTYPDRYFSVNANTINAAKPVAAIVKYNFFRRFILSLDLIVSLYAGYPGRIVPSCNTTVEKSSLFDIETGSRE